MFPFFSSLFGFVPSNEHTISWEALAMRQREEELFYAIKTDVQWSEEELEKIKHLIHHPLFNVNRLYYTENITETLLHQAIKYKQFKVALCLVEKGADSKLLKLETEVINNFDDNGQTLLHLACIKQPHLTPFLLERGANPSLQDKLGNTSLHYYCMYGSFILESPKDKEILNQLTNKLDNFSIAFKNKEGKRALDLLSQKLTELRINNDDLFVAEMFRGNKKFVGNNSALPQEWYKEKSAFIKNFINNSQWSRAKREHIQWFLETDADLTFHHWERRVKLQADTAWCEHIKSKLNNSTGYTEVLLAFLVWYGGSKPEFRKEVLLNRRYALFAMIENKVPPLFISLLLEKGGKEGLRFQDSKGNTILHHIITVLQNHLQMLSHNSRSSEEDETDINHNWFWIEYKHICGALELLLQARVNPNQQNVEGETPLHQLAAMRNVTQNKYFDRCQSYMASILRENGTNLELKTKSGKTAIEIAEMIQGRNVVLKSQDNNIIITLKRKNYISHLPTELLINIFEQLSRKELAKLNKVSHQFNNIIHSWYFWIKYLRPSYQDLMRIYIHNLKDNQDDFQVDRKASDYLRKMIQKAPYTVKPAYFEYIFQEKHIKWTSLNSRNKDLFTLNQPDLWNRLIEGCKQRVTDDCTLAQIVLATAKIVASDEEIALTYLRHTEFRKFVLEDNPESVEWLLDIFQASIQYKLYDAEKEKPITYELVGASRLSTALFILNDKDYGKKLAKGLREDKDRLKNIQHQLQNIRFDLVEASHRGDEKAKATAKFISEKLKSLSTPGMSRSFMSAPSRQL
jgi:ankyrin repeat protein